MLARKRHGMSLKTSSKPLVLSKNKHLRLLPLSAQDLQLPHTAGIGDGREAKLLFPSGLGPRPRRSWRQRRVLRRRRSERTFFVARTNGCSKILVGHLQVMSHVLTGGSISQSDPPPAVATDDDGPGQTGRRRTASSSGTRMVKVPPRTLKVRRVPFTGRVPGTTGLWLGLYTWNQPTEAVQKAICGLDILAEDQSAYFFFYKQIQTDRVVLVGIFQNLCPLLSIHLHV